MMSKQRVMSVGLVIVGLMIGTSARAQVSDAQNKLLARRAAEADCYRKLAETVYGVQINSDTYVRDFVTESDNIRAALDTFVKGIKLGQPRYYDDGICEVDAEVTVAKLVTTLKRIHTETYRGRATTISDIENIKQTVKKDVIRVTGSGAPRPDLPPDLPFGVADIITPLPSGYAPPARSVPAIWRTIPPNQRLLAERAARVDAMRKLLERIKGLRLTSDTLVRDFITESDEISASASGIVIGARQVSKYLHDEELIVEVTMEVPVERIVTRIKELHKAHYQGRHVAITDIVNIKKIVQGDTIEATGSGVPRMQAVSQAIQSGHDMPKWLTRRVEAIGQGTDAAIHTAQGKLKAARAAKLDAMRKLAETIYGLQIQSSTTVRDFVTENDEISTQLQAVLVGAVADEAVFADDVAEVRVSLPAANVWSVIHQHMLIVGRRS